MFTYFLRQRLRNKAFLFWCLVFPLALMMCFHVAFGNLNTSDDIDTRKVAIVNANDDASYAKYFETLIDQLCEKGTNGDDALFIKQEYKDEDAVREALIEGKIAFAFKVKDNKVEVLLPDSYSTTDVAVSKSVAETFMQHYGLIMSAMEKNPGEAMELINNLGTQIDYVDVQKSEFEDETPNTYIWYYYASLVMGILFSAMNGVDLVQLIKADCSSSAMRLSVSPAKKYKLIASSFAAFLLIALSINVIQLIIMNYVFRVPLGNNLGKLALFILATNVFSLALGIVCGCVFKGSIDARSNKTTGLIMASVFLSGEMVAQLPGIIEMHCPIINDINPATVMNMALFRLCYSTADFDFYTNMVKIIVAAFVLLTISVMILRREKYASI